MNDEDILLLTINFVSGFEKRSLGRFTRETRTIFGISGIECNTLKLKVFVL